MENKCALETLKVFLQTKCSKKQSTLLSTLALHGGMLGGTSGWLARGNTCLVQAEPASDADPARLRAPPRVCASDAEPHADELRPRAGGCDQLLA